MRRMWAASAAIVTCLALGGVPALAQEGSAVPTSTATPAPTPSVVVTRNLAYESSNPVLTPGKLDVYAPARAGSWPVVVMFHAPTT